MEDNFDCTQFITFDYEGFDNINGIIYDSLRESSFHVLSYNEIRKVKKVYFRRYMERYFFELKHDEFMGEFEDWKNESEPTILVQEFISILGKLLELNLKKFKIILTNFAEEGKSSNKLVTINSSKIEKGLFYMSKYNYDIWADNLILEIED